MLYGCESWSLTKTHEKSLDGTHTQMHRGVLNVMRQMTTLMVPYLEKSASRSVVT